MSDLKQILLRAKESLEHIEKQAKTLGLALKNASPDDGMRNPSVQYLLNAAHELENTKKQYEQKIEELENILKDKK